MAYLEMNSARVKRALEDCKKYLNEAETTINLLESDIASEMKTYGMKITALTSGFGALLMVGTAAYVGKDILGLSLKEIAKQLGYVRGGLIVGGAAYGTRCLYACYSLIIDKHRKKFENHIKTLNEQLRQVKAEYNRVKAVEQEVSGIMVKKN